MSFKNLRGGDTIEFWRRNGAGQPRTLIRARVQHLLVFPEHVVVNLGGRYGTPYVVDATNFERLLYQAPVKVG